MRVKTQLVAVLANRRQLVPCTMFSHIPTPSSAPTCQWDGKNQGSWGLVPISIPAAYNLGNVPLNGDDGVAPPSTHQIKSPHTIPTMQCVVDMGMPNADAKDTVTATASSAQ